MPPFVTVRDPAGVFVDRDDAHGGAVSSGPPGWVPDEGVDVGAQGLVDGAAGPAVGPSACDADNRSAEGQEDRLRRG